MGIEDGEEEGDEGDPAVALQDLQRVRQEAKEHMIKGIIQARDKDHLTFREIGDHLGMAHSWVFRLYKRGKKAGL